MNTIIDDDEKTIDYTSYNDDDPKVTSASRPTFGCLTPHKAASVVATGINLNGVKIEYITPQRKRTMDVIPNHEHRSKPIKIRYPKLRVSQSHQAHAIHSSDEDDDDNYEDDEEKEDVDIADMLRMEYQKEYINHFKRSRKESYEIILKRQQQHNHVDSDGDEHLENLSLSNPPRRTSFSSSYFNADSPSLKPVNLSTRFTLEGIHGHHTGNLCDYETKVTIDNIPMHPHFIKEAANNESKGDIR